MEDISKHFRSSIDDQKPKQVFSFSRVFASARQLVIHLDSLDSRPLISIRLLYLQQRLPYLQFSQVIAITPCHHSCVVALHLAWSAKGNKVQQGGFKDSCFSRRRPRPTASLRVSVEARGDRLISHPRLTPVVSDGSPVLVLKIDYYIVMA